MRSIERVSWVILGIFLAIVIVACGSASTGTYSNGGGNTGANPTATSGSSSAPCGRYSACVTPTAKTGGSTVSINTATATLHGKSVQILTNAQGLTLYYRTSDTASSVCSGSCATAWPPMLSTSVPASATSLPGKITLLTDTNGSQLAYNGHPLYTFSGDNAAGQMNGDGIGGVWFVVTTDLAT